jgi:quercetin 2,3-dioxygenase
MPAVTVESVLALPRIPRPATLRPRPVVQLAEATPTTEGAGFNVWRSFPGSVTSKTSDPIIGFDQVGPNWNGPNETAGAPWHPHRGFETVTYVIDGEIAHHDTHGGGGVIGNGDTQWMTAGSGILHDELPTERLYRQGGLVHHVQMWVNLPAALKMTRPRYQPISGHELTLVTTEDGGALVRIIAGEVAGHAGPGATLTPITYLHATIAPGAELALPWNPAYNAMAYALAGQGTAGPQERPLRDHQLIVFGEGDHLTVRAGDRIEGEIGTLELLVVGGLPIREPIAWHGPFVMNTRDEIVRALDDYRAGRMGILPAGQLGPRHFA